MQNMAEQKARAHIGVMIKSHRCKWREKEEGGDKKSHPSH